MKIAIGTQNPAKVQAIQKAFSQLYEQAEFEALQAESHVSEQPLSDEETIEGALNRARGVLESTGSEIGIGLEGGVSDSTDGMILCNWGALVDSNGNEIIAGGARIPLPEEISAKIQEGYELGPLMDDYTKRTGISKKEGAIGVFTNDLITREAMFMHVVLLLIGQWQCRTGAQKS
ncbi:DUF84 family protein [Bacillus sp. KH172YL63]|uniref:DUF84 family protein n=1 Tax=Bacillus sp. KH172YL63 TaxID=2709784 RepID=UPI0013E4FEF5|nr:DUF84 family protein [Bacillus sp. KH172YL63]BCB05314.1 NTPase [Bacillus sp. KH172YL63]